jgi:hypothetical protein
MATITLNLPIEKSIAEGIEKFAVKRKTSISRMVENYFSIIMSSTGTKEDNISPLVKSFSIEGVDIPDGFDYKKEMSAARNKKYLQ